MNIPPLGELSNVYPSNNDPTTQALLLTAQIEKLVDEMQKNISSPNLVQKSLDELNKLSFGVCLSANVIDLEKTIINSHLGLIKIHAGLHNNTNDLSMELDFLKQRLSLLQKHLLSGM